jgi:putative transposase
LRTAGHLDWPYSSFKHYVARGDLPPDWGGDVGELAGSFGE